MPGRIKPGNLSGLDESSPAAMRLKLAVISRALKKKLCQLISKIALDTSIDGASAPRRESGAI